MDPLLEKVLMIAAGQIGQKEQGGRNRGPMVDEYIRAARLDPAVASYPWCACFVQWAFREACNDIGIVNPLPRTAAVHGLWQRSPQGVHFDEPAVGDIFLIDHGRGKGHCGLVERLEDAVMWTIEGNTNLAGGREGDGVYRRTRKYDEINLGYLRFSGYAKPKGLVS